MVWLLVGGDEEKWKGLQKGVFICCNVVMCSEVTVWGEGGKWKGLRKEVFIWCNVVMCSVVSGWVKGREMERVTDRGLYVL